MKYTPVEKHGPFYFKRDDRFRMAGVSGGKVRSCWHMATERETKGLITAGSRSSPQVNIVAHIAQKLGIPCRVHVPSGELSPEVLSAQQCGAEIIRHKVGYNTVIKARAIEDAQKHVGWTHIPFGMECTAAVKQTRLQVQNIPKYVKRLVVPVGSGMSLAGILHGLKDNGRIMPVLGVMVGANPLKRLLRYAPFGWQHTVTLKSAGSDYHQPSGICEVEGVRLDSIYEAKCIPWLEPDDCLWIVGIRQTEEK